MAEQTVEEAIRTSIASITKNRSKEGDKYLRMLVEMKEALERADAILQDLNKELLIDKGYKSTPK